jgi:hypothetical protein
VAARECIATLHRGVLSIELRDHASEITPEMIEAGEEAIREKWWMLGDLGPDFSARDLAIAVWRAMDRCRQRE